MTSTADIGNSAILSYEVYWDANTGNLNLLLSDNLDTLKLVERLDAGLSYKFKVRARNIYGYGPFSDVTDLIPDAEPAIMVAAET